MKGKSFELVNRDGLARVARLTTSHGAMTTPTVLPVINPNLKVIPAKEMRDFGAEGIITNSYIIRRNPDLREKAEKDGVHSLVKFDGPIMTDSGTFQSYVYGDMEYGNLEIVNFQRTIGSDIATILDIFSTPDQTHEQARDAVSETYRRVREVEPIENSFLAGPIQGSIYVDQRRRSSRLMGSSPADYLPIGGVVPLLEQYRYRELVRIIWESKNYGNKGKPIHLFGGGHPMFFAFAVYLGVDLFDSASYVKYARDSRLLFPDGTRDLKKIRELPQWSPIASKATVRELVDMDERERTVLLSRHNLFAMFQELAEVRERIYEQGLWEYVQRKALDHPSLYEAFQEIKRIQRGMETYTELSRRTSYFSYSYNGRRNLWEDRVARFSEAFLSTRKSVVVLGPDWRQSPTREHVMEGYESSDAAFVVPWCGIHVPIELEDTYPVQQVVDGGAVKDRDKWIRGMIKKYGLSVAGSETKNVPRRSFNLQKLRTIADFQFAFGAGDSMFPEETEIRVSRNTGRIRTASLGDAIHATLRATDGLLSLTMQGAGRLKEFSVSPQFEVRVNRDSAEFNRKGYSVFFKFVEHADPELVPGNETLVVDPDDKLIAVGRSTVSGREMRDYRHGVAVKIHHSLEGRETESAD